MPWARIHRTIKKQVLDYFRHLKPWYMLYLDELVKPIDDEYSTNNVEPALRLGSRFKEYAIELFDRTFREIETGKSPNTDEIMGSPPGTATRSQSPTGTSSLTSQADEYIAAFSSKVQKIALQWKRGMWDTGSVVNALIEYNDEGAPPALIVQAVYVLAFNRFPTDSLRIIWNAVRQGPLGAPSASEPMPTFDELSPLGLDVEISPAEEEAKAIATAMASATAMPPAPSAPLRLPAPPPSWRDVVAHRAQAQAPQPAWRNPVQQGLQAQAGPPQPPQRGSAPGPARAPPKSG